jgi:hypothetical protein
MFPSRRIPIFRAYPVRLSVTPTQRAAEGEVHPEDATATSSASSLPILSEVGALFIGS